MPCSTLVRTRWSVMVSLALITAAPLQADPPPTRADDIPTVFCFRFTDIEAVAGDPEGDRFRFSFEILNWTDRPAHGLYLAVNTASGSVLSGRSPFFAAVDVDVNGRPLGPGDDDANFPPADGTPHSKIGAPNLWIVADHTPTRALFEAPAGQGAVPALPILSVPCRGIPGCVIVGGKAEITDFELLDNTNDGHHWEEDHVLDGFVLDIDDFDPGEAISVNWFLLDQQGDPIGVTGFGNAYGFGVLNLFRAPAGDSRLWQRTGDSPQGGGANTGATSSPRDMFVSSADGVQFLTEMAGAMTAPYRNAADDLFGAQINAVAAHSNVPLNPHFSCDLSHWAGDGSWSPQDAAGSVESGSFHLIDDGSTANPNRRQCVAVMGGTEYQLGHRYLVPAGQPERPTAQLTLTWHRDATCSDSSGGGNIHSGSTEGIWAASPIIITSAPVDAASAEIILYTVAQGPSRPVETFFDDVLFAPTSECVTFGSVLCLQGGRFRVQAAWRTPQGDSGSGQARQLTSDSGSFWFFDNTNTELDVKVLDACVPPFDRFWFFAAGLTNVEVTLTVEDLAGNETRTYTNALGSPFAPVLDTNAFATCP
jgi:hypothetical protein